MGAARDLSGQRFGKLTAISPTDRRSNGGIMWFCQCDCGRETYVRVDSLTMGKTRSCGCLNRYYLAGEQFSRLTVVRETDLRQGNSIVWECKCACGETCFVPTAVLTSGKQVSCGCYRQEQFLVHGRCGTKEYEKWKNRRYRKRVKEATVEDFAPMDIQHRMEELGGVCIFCGGEFEHVDHFIPLNRGGAHSLCNLVPACANCNKIKSDQLVGSEWVPEHWDELRSKIAQYQIGEAVDGL